MTETTASPASSGSRAGRVILGLLLAAPAAFACLLSFLLPTITQVGMSFQDISLFGGGTSRPVGMDNYAALGKVIGGALDMTLLVTGVRLAAVLIVPPLLAWGISRSLPMLRIGSRLFLAIPAALFAPFLGAVAWFLTLRPTGEPASFRGALLLADGIATLSLACAVIVPAYLAALTPTDDAAPDGKMPWRAVATIWLLSLLAVLALTPQVFDLSYVTAGGPARSTTTLMLELYREGFQRMKFGPAAALGTLVLAPVMLAGLIAGAVVVWSGLRMQTTSSNPFDQSRGGSIALGAIMLALAAGCGLLAALPYFTAMIQPAFGPSGGADVFGRTNPISAAFSTALPQIMGLPVQLILTYLAALGIGGVRPLGKRSELLLLPFSPWLFVTAAPLISVLYLAARQSQMINTFFALMPRFAISIPILFVLTLFFKGQEAKRQAYGVADASTAGDFFRNVVLPSLPLAALLGIAAVLVGMQDLEWPIVAVNERDLFTLPVVVAQILGQYGTRGPDVAAALMAAEMPVFVVFGLIFGVFQVFYLPRLALTGLAQGSQGSRVAAAEPAASPAESDA